MERSLLVEETPRPAPENPALKVSDLALDDCLEHVQASLLLESQ